MMSSKPAPRAPRRRAPPAAPPLPPAPRRRAPFRPAISVSSDAPTPYAGRVVHRPWDAAGSRRTKSSTSSDAPTPHAGRIVHRPWDAARSGLAEDSTSSDAPAPYAGRVVHRPWDDARPKRASGKKNGKAPVVRRSPALQNLLDVFHADEANWPPQVHAMVENIDATRDEVIAEGMGRSLQRLMHVELQGLEDLNSRLQAQAAELEEPIMPRVTRSASKAAAGAAYPPASRSRSNVQTPPAMVAVPVDETLQGPSNSQPPSTSGTKGKGRGKSTAPPTDVEVSAGPRRSARERKPVHYGKQHKVFFPKLLR